MCGHYSPSSWARNQVDPFETGGYPICGAILWAREVVMYLNVDSRHLCDGSMTLRSRHPISCPVRNHNKRQFPTTMQSLRRPFLSNLTPIQFNLLARSTYRCSSSYITNSATSASRKTLAAGQLTQSQRQLLKTAASRKEFNMASDNSKAHNNADFQLSEVFNVKGKVALITGKLERSNGRPMLRRW